MFDSLQVSENPDRYVWEAMATARDFEAAAKVSTYTPEEQARWRDTAEWIRAYCEPGEELTRSEADDRAMEEMGIGNGPDPAAGGGSVPVWVELEDPLALIRELQAAIECAPPRTRR